MSPLTFPPEDLAFDVGYWREITDAANKYLHEGLPFPNLSGGAIDELYDIGTEVTQYYDENQEAQDASD